MSYQVIPAGFFLGVEQRSRVDLAIGTGFHDEFGNSFYTSTNSHKTLLVELENVSSF